MRISFLDDRMDKKPAKHTQPGPQWDRGFDRIKVPEASKEVADQRWTGVVVSTIDTGARRTHYQLRDSYRGDYGWFDPIDGTREPYDTLGHGTFCLGKIVGYTNQTKKLRNLGVAPDAQWMACLTDLPIGRLFGGRF